MTGPSAGLTFLAYSSTATHPFSEADLEVLLAGSRARNTSAEISGLLLYREQKFIQFLEGPTDRVLDLMDSIARDDRHQGVRVLWQEETASRRFAEWTMGYHTMRAPDRSSGFRDSFDDIESPVGSDQFVRAVRDLTIWFRVRSHAPI